MRFVKISKKAKNSSVSTPFKCILFFHSNFFFFLRYQTKRAKKISHGKLSGNSFFNIKKTEEKSVCSQWWWCGKQSIKSHSIWVIFVGSFSLHQMRIIYSMHEWVLCAVSIVRKKWVEAASTWENLARIVDRRAW